MENLVTERRKIMVPVLTLALIIFIFYRINTSTDRKFNNRRSPPGMKTDWGAFNHDLARGKSQTEVKDKFNRGEYDIPCGKDDVLNKYRKK